MWERKKEGKTERERKALTSTGCHTQPMSNHEWQLGDEVQGNLIYAKQLRHILSNCHSRDTVKCTVCDYSYFLCHSKRLYIIICTMSHVAVPVTLHFSFFLRKLLAEEQAGGYLLQCTRVSADSGILSNMKLPNTGLFWPLNSIF